MAEPPRSPRPSRRARERALRRRRATAVLVLLGLVAGILGLTLAFGSGSSKHSSATTGSETTSRGTTTQSTQPSKRAERQARQRLDTLSYEAAVRYAELGRTVFCGGTGKKMIALTFDDGPGPYTASSILHVLRRRHARATFFLVGQRIDSWPKVPAQEALLGAVGDHTWNHAMLTGLDDNAMKSEVEDAQHAISNATGRPVTLFRPPYGATDSAVEQEVQSLGMVQVMWSLDSLDWQGGSWKDLEARVLANVHPGSIILMHDIHPNTIAAVWRLVPALHHLGYRLVTVPELLALDPPSDNQLARGVDGCKGNVSGSSGA